MVEQILKLVYWTIFFYLDFMLLGNGCEVLKYIEIITQSKFSLLLID